MRLAGNARLTAIRRIMLPQFVEDLSSDPVSTIRPSVPPPDLVCGYAIERRLGRGGFGVVYVGRRVSSGLRAAIKIAHPGDRTERDPMACEAATLAAIGPPAAPALYASGILQDGRSFLAMELFPVPTLQVRLSALAGPMPLADFARYAGALVDALAAVHARGYAHLDVKPANIFVCDAPLHGRFADFGLARPLSGEAPSQESGLIAGTVAYMAPEQCAGQARLDAHADVYAAGVVLYEMLTGRPPFVGLEGEVREAHLHLRPRPPSGVVRVHPAIEDVILRCLAKDPERRYASAIELARALADARAQGAFVATTPAPSLRTMAGGRATPAERRRVGMVFLRTSVELAAAETALEAFGGHLAYLAGGRGVAIFEGDESDNPVRRALRAADGILQQGLATHAVVDLGQVAVLRRTTGGAPRYLSSAFVRDERYPRLDDPEKLLISASAAEVMAGLLLDMAPGRDGAFRPRAPRGSTPPDWTSSGDELIEPVGRSTLIAELMESAEIAVKGRRPTVVTVLAEAGHGKTCLAAALGRSIGWSMPQVERIALIAREPLPGDADGVLRRLLRRVLDWPSTPPTDNGLACTMAALGPTLGRELWPAVALVLGILPPDSPVLRNLGAAPGVLRSMAMRAAGEALRRRAARRPICLILDDAQFADNTTLDALEYAALSEAAAPFFVCVFAQPSFETARRAFGDRACAHMSHRLGSLEPPVAGELCRKLLLPAENVPSEAVDRLVQRTRGIPLLLVELVRGLKREGLVRRHERGESFYLATDEIDRLPDLPLVEWLALREINALGADLGAHVRLAALLGPELLVEEIEGVLMEIERDGDAAAFPLDAGSSVERLIAAGIFSTGERGALRFRHAVVREVVARNVPEPLRQQIHRAAVRFYQRTTMMPERLGRARLAHHAAAIGLAGEAAGIYLDLAERARERHAYLDAERTYSRALALLSEKDRERRLAAHRGRGGMRYRIGRYDDSLLDYQAARSLARALGDRQAETELLLDEATALDWTSDYARSEARVAEAAVLGTQGSQLLSSRLLAGKGRALFRKGRWAEACEALERAAAIADELGDAGYETSVIAKVMLEVVLPNLGRLDEAERLSERLIELLERRGDQLHLGSALNNRRNALIARGDVARAVADQQTFMRIGRELGVALAEYFAEYNMGELLYQAGDLVAAEPHVRRAVAFEARHAEVASRPVAVLLAARVHAYQGRSTEARTCLTQMDTSIRRGGAGSALSVSEAVLFTMVDLASRDAASSEWEALMSRASRDSIEQEPIEVAEMRGIAALRRGRLVEGVRALEHALALTDRIPNIMKKRVSRALTHARMVRAREAPR